MATQRMAPVTFGQPTAAVTFGLDPEVFATEIVGSSPAMFAKQTRLTMTWEVKRRNDTGS